MIELNPLQTYRTPDTADGGGPGPPPSDGPPPTTSASASVPESYGDTIEVSGQALDFPAASSDEENDGYTGAATYSSAGQPLAATGGLLDITG